uniref:Uncharacterized protein n=1 Tax=Steinernema glaseri TaxID=37863 RepID=A0A1I7YW97_9BILA
MALSWVFHFLLDPLSGRQAADSPGDHNAFFPSNEFQSPDRARLDRIHSNSFSFFDSEVAATPTSHREKEIIRPRIISVDDASTPSPYSLDYGFLQESPGIRLAQPLRFVRRLSPEPPRPPIVITTSADEERPVAPSPPAMLLDDATTLPKSSSSASDQEDLLEQLADDSSSSSAPGCSKRCSTSSENDSDSTRMELETAPPPEPFESQDGEDEGVMMTSMVSATGDEIGYQILEDSSGAELDDRQEVATPTPLENVIPLESVFNFDMKKSPSQELPVISEDVDEGPEEEHPEEERPEHEPQEDRTTEEAGEEQKEFHKMISSRVYRRRVSPIRSLHLVRI